MRIAASPFRALASLLVSGALVSGGLLVVEAPSAHATAGPVGLTFLGRHSGDEPGGVAPDGASEITAYDPSTKRMFVTNGRDSTLDIVDISNPAAPADEVPVDLGRPLQSVAVKNGLVAVVLEGVTRQAPGELVVLDTDGVEQWRVTVGALPDMVTFTPDGTKILTANEGEPLDYCTPGTATDPEGSVSVVDVATQTVTPVGFGAFTDSDALRAQGIRIFGPNATPAQDLEPEYIAVTPDGTKAYVTLQENNAFAVIDIATGTVDSLVPLGYQSYTDPGSGIDTTDRELGNPGPQVNIATRSPRVHGMYMPDAIDAFETGGATYVATANEGDAREYACFPGGRDDLRVNDHPGRLDTVTPDPVSPPFTVAEESDAQLRRIRASSVFPLLPADQGPNGIKQVYTHGSRSFTIRDLAGNVVFDSHDDFEQITADPANYGGAFFNGEWDESSGAFLGFDRRSPAKGPEPEAVEVGAAYGRTFAFVGLERSGGVMVYDVTDPANASFVQYVNTADPTGNYKFGTAGDVAPEGILFVPAADSPTGKPLVLVSYELSGTTGIFELNGPPTVSAAADVTVGEAVGSTAVAVTLSEDTTEVVTVDYALAAGSATEGDDFVAQSGILEFAPGETVASVLVDVVPDAIDEQPETLSLVLSNPSVSGILGDAETVITITDDDPPALSIGDASIVEGDKGLKRLQFTLTLSSPAERNTLVLAVTRPGTAKPVLDYLPDLDLVLFRTGDVAKTLNVRIVGDKKKESDETFSVRLEGALGPVTFADASGIATIINDD